MSSEHKIHGNLKSDSYRGKGYRLMMTTNDGQVVPAEFGVAVLPTARKELRGRMFLLEGASGVADIAYVCYKKADDTYDWADIYMGTL